MKTRGRGWASTEADSKTGDRGRRRRRPFRRHRSAWNDLDRTRRRARRRATIEHAQGDGVEPGCVALKLAGQVAEASRVLCARHLDAIRVRIDGLVTDRIANARRVIAAAISAHALAATVVARVGFAHRDRTTRRLVTAGTLATGTRAARPSIGVARGFIRRAATEGEAHEGRRDNAANDEAHGTDSKAYSRAYEKQRGHFAPASLCPRCSQCRPRFRRPGAFRRARAESVR
jgi:hypothetical protein